MGVTLESSNSIDSSLTLCPKNRSQTGVVLKVDRESAFVREVQGQRVTPPPGALCVCRYDMMLSCWNDDPLKRPSFQKLVESTEMLLSENTKNVREFEIIAIILSERTWGFYMAEVKPYQHRKHEPAHISNLDTLNESLHFYYCLLPLDS